MTVNVRQARHQDIDDMARLHESSFPGFFLTRLGIGFLRVLYRAFVQRSANLSLVAVETDGSGRESVVGLVVGTSEPGSFFRTALLRQGPQFVAAAIPQLLREPRFVARRLLGALFYRGERPPGLSDAVLLSSIAVAPSLAGQDVGCKLIRAFTERARLAGGKVVYLMTDAMENEPVNRFYLRAGFELDCAIPRSGGRTMNRYTMPLRPAGAAGASQPPSTIGAI